MEAISMISQLLALPTPWGVVLAPTTQAAEAVCGGHALFKTARQMPSAIYMLYVTSIAMPKASHQLMEAISMT